MGTTAEGVVLTLGDGVDRERQRDAVAAGIHEANNALAFDVYALTHPGLAVDHSLQAQRATPTLTGVSVGQLASAAPGSRLALSYNAPSDTTTDVLPARMFSARYEATRTSITPRAAPGTGADFAAWVQGIDFCRFEGCGRDLRRHPRNLHPAGVQLEHRDPGEHTVTIPPGGTRSPSPTRSWSTRDPPASLTSIDNTATVSTAPEPVRRGAAR